MNRLRALGALDLRDVTGRELRTLLAQPKRLALLIYLGTANPRSFHRRDTLVALLWPELDTEHARNALRQALHFLRQGLGADSLPARGVEEVGIAPDRLAVDVVEFEAALKTGDLERALELYRGDLLPGFFISEAPTFERWLDERRSELRGRAAAAAWQLATRAEQAGDRAGATAWGRRATLLAPDDEHGVRRLLELHLRLGDRRGALRAYADFAKRLRQEFEAEPAAETQALIAEARSPVPTLASRTPKVAPAALPSVAPAVASLGRVWTTRRLAAAAGALLVLLAVGATLAYRRGEPRPSAGQAIAVMPFPVRGRADLAYLHEGMVDLLSAKLDGTAGLRTVDPRAVLGAVQRQDSVAPIDPTRAAAIAGSLDAKYFVVGDVVEIAGRINLNSALYSGPRRVATATVSGESTNLFQLVDDLTGQLLAGLSRGRDTALTRLAAVTTHSLPALKAYLDGEQALRAGNDQEAGTAFLTAALLDTGFALAQYRLALTATWVNVRGVTDPSEWANTAARHAGHLTPLGRDLLSAYGAYKAIQAVESENAYRSITEAHPDNIEAWLMLGETRFHYIPFLGRSPMEAQMPFQRALALDPSDPHAMLHLARLAAREGQTSALDSLAREYLERYPTSDRALEMRALQTFMHGDSAARVVTAREAAGAADYTLTSLLQDAIWYAQDLASARSLAAPVMTAVSPISRPVDQRILTDLTLIGGQWGPDALAGLSRNAVDQDWRLESLALAGSDPFFAVSRARLLALRDSIVVRQPYHTPGLPAGSRDSALGSLMQDYLVGLLSVRLGDSLVAARSLAALDAVHSVSTASAASGLAHGLRAEIARTRGDYRAALAEIDAFAFGPPTTALAIAHWGMRERFLRAEVLHALKRDPEALPWYQSFPAGYDGPYIPAAHRRLAEIYQRMGNRERARFHLTRFIALWNACDPELRPKVDSARAALSAQTLQ